MVDITNPRAIAMILPVLRIAEQVCVDLIRGNPVKQRDVALLREGLLEVKDLVRALNASQPWVSPSASESPSESPSTSPSASESPSASPSVAP